MVDHRLWVVDPDDALGRALNLDRSGPGFVDVHGRVVLQCREVTPVNSSIVICKALYIGILYYIDISVVGGSQRYPSTTKYDLKLYFT